MIGFWIFMLIMLLLVPLSMLGMGTYFSKNTPKDINHFIGYRTTRSMKNEDTWKFAHNYCGKLWKRIGLIMIPITIIVMLFSYGKDIDYVGIYGTYITMIQVVVMTLSIWPVEAALKRNFDENGKPLK